MQWQRDRYEIDTDRGRLDLRAIVGWIGTTIIEHPELSSVRWLLHAADAHDLYRQVGFRQPGPRVMERPPHSVAARGGHS